ncbi:myosin-13-like isoform X1 [Pomacea canaliculata]|uniref:myosin-13-like isoform X1 n=1 Tax=Pomacea canaliculata TaxID=400727 RepID=UPI000D73B02C|nr:myosin-13-like isoform X1 [Pomacea canaliculata]
MATRSDADDATSICSICLEPYKGRNPKLLPCFHTLCLPCLKDLEQHSLQALSDRKGSQDDDRDNPPLTFPCPTCRAVITVPPGGVIQFQTNFYLNDDTLTCQICDLGNEATYNCSECSQNMCDHCKRYHNKFLPSHKVEPLTFSCKDTSQISFEPEKEGTITQQLAVLEAALVTMREEEGTLERERQAVADVISRRANAARALVTQAEERSQKELSEVAERLRIQIQEEMVATHNIHGKIFTLMSQERGTGQANPISRKVQTVLLSDENLRLVQERCSSGRQSKLIQYQYNDVAIDMKIVGDYIGTVCDGKQPAGETSNVQVSESVCAELQSSERQWKTMAVTPKLSDTTKLSCDIGESEDMLTHDTPSHYLERYNSAMTELRILKEEISNLKMDVSILKETDSMAEKKMRNFEEKLENVKEELSRTEKVTTSIKQETETVKTVNYKLQNAIDNMKLEYSIIKRETNKAKENINDLEIDLESFKEKSSSMVAFDARLHVDITVDEDETDIFLRDVNCNVGEAYNKNTGIFIAPVTGIYFFMARTVKVKTPDFSLDIQVDGNRVAESLWESSPRKANGSCVVHLVQKLSQGQEVTLSTYTSSEATLRRRETSFSGMLVRPELDIE